MNESLKTKGDKFLFGNVEFLYKVSYEFNSEKDIFEYIKEKGILNGWNCEIHTSTNLLLTNIKHSDKKNILIYSYVDSFNQIDESIVEKKIKDMEVVDNKIYTQETILKARNIINISNILSIIEKKIETNLSWEVIENEYNISVMLISDKSNISNELMDKFKNDLIIGIDSGDNNLLEITQPNNLNFEITKVVNTDLNSKINNYLLEIESIFKDDEIDKIKKEQFNSLKLNLNILDKIKKEFDVNIIDITNSSKLNDRKYSSKIVFSSEESDINSIIEPIREWHENIKQELSDKSIGVRFEIKKIKNKRISEYINHDDIECIKNILNDIDYISNKNTINLGELYIKNKSMKLKGIVKLYNIEEKTDIKNKLIDLSKEKNVNIKFSNEIPLWAINKESSLRNIALKNYRKNNSKSNRIVTVSNSEYVSDKLKVENNNDIISYIYKIYKEDNYKEYIKESDIIKNWTCLGGFLEELIPNNVKEKYYNNYKFDNEPIENEDIERKNK